MSDKAIKECQGSLKRDDIHARMRDNLTAMIWKDNRDVHILTNIHRPPKEDNFSMNMG
jgi:hypothetical protein